MRRAYLSRPVLILFCLFLIGCGFRGCSNYPVSATAPDVSFAERHAWGEETFGDLFSRVEHWIKSAHYIQDLLGHNVAAAPEGESKCSCAFTDGCSCTLNLEVIGSKVPGKITVSGAFIDTFSGNLHIGRADLKIKDATFNIHPTGISVAAWHKPENLVKVLRDPLSQHQLLLRAKAWFLVGDVNAAMADLDKGMADLLNVKCLKVTENCSDRVSLANGRDVRDFLLTKATMEAFSNRHTSVNYTIRQALHTSIPLNTDHGQDELLAWIVLRQSGYRQEANEILKERLENCRSKIKYINKLMAAYLDREELPQRKSSHYGFHTAMKFWFDGDRKKGLNILNAYMSTLPPDQSSLQSFFVKALILRKEGQNN